ncbi:MAG: class I SAM-dependent methyltransferase [bacterium]
MDKNNWESDVLGIREHYRSKIEKRGGVSAASLDWRNSEKQETVFYNAIADLSGKFKTVFDVGCGSGDLYRYMTNNGFDIDGYHGIDIVPEFVEYGTKNKVPNLQVGNFLSSKNEDKYDLVINLGGLNSKTSFYEQYLIMNISKMIKISKKYVVFNLITKASDSYFPNQNQSRVGHITSITNEQFTKIIKKIKKSYPNIRYQKKNVAIFPGSIDTFVRITVCD